MSLLTRSTFINQTHPHTLYFTCLSCLHINKLSNVTNTEEVAHMCVCVCVCVRAFIHHRLIVIASRAFSTDGGLFDWVSLVIDDN